MDESLLNHMDVRSVIKSLIDYVDLKLFISVNGEVSQVRQIHFSELDGILIISDTKRIDWETFDGLLKKAKEQL